MRHGLYTKATLFHRLARHKHLKSRYTSDAFAFKGVIAKLDSQYMFCFLRFLSVPLPTVSFELMATNEGLSFVIMLALEYEYCVWISNFDNHWRENVRVSTHIVLVVPESRIYF